MNSKEVTATDGIVWCDHEETIALAFDNLVNLPNDIIIISAEKDQIKTCKHLLSLFSPLLKNLLSSTPILGQTIYLPDHTTRDIKSILNLLTNGLCDVITSTELVENLDDEIDTQVVRMTEIAKLLNCANIDITNIFSCFTSI